VDNGIKEGKRGRRQKDKKCIILLSIRETAPLNLSPIPHPQ